MDLYQTACLISATETLAPVPSFLRDRYFPTNPATDIVHTSKVLAEFREGDKRMAPVVMLGGHGVNVSRAESQMREIEPCNLAPSRPLTLDDISKRGFGEAILGDKTPEQRAAVLAAMDLRDLDAMISRREEYIAASVMLDNACTMQSWGDEAEEAEPYTLKYYETTTNPAAYTVDEKWDSSSANILGDLWEAAKMLTDRGLSAVDFVCAPDVAYAVATDASVQKLLDNRSTDFGNLAPVMQANGAALFGRLNANGVILNIISYGMTYQDDAKATKSYIPSGCGVLAAPGAGHTVYGAVTQLEQADGEFHTYAARRVPKFTADANDNNRLLTMTARPVCVPYNANAFISMKGLLTPKA